MRYIIGFLVGIVASLALMDHRIEAEREKVLRCLAYEDCNGVNRDTLLGARSELY